MRTTFLPPDALNDPAHVYNVDWYKTTVLHNGRASFLSLLLFSDDSDLLSSGDVFLISARSLLSFKMEKRISHFYSQAAKRAQMGPGPSTPYEPTLEAPATAPTVEEMVAVTVEAGAGATEGQSCGRGGQYQGGDVVAAEVVATGGDCRYPVLTLPSC